MRTADFDYHLPLERIAQTPIEPRHNSRLMILKRDASEIEHARFYEIGRYLQSGDLLVINQTRVIPARLYARKSTGGRVELLLLKQLDENEWETLVGGKGLRTGLKVQVEGGPEAEIIEEMESSRRLVRFSPPIGDFLPAIGEMPLPPYIHEKLADRERYQTVYALSTGSAAAPTAGLHFTPGLMEELSAAGIQFCRLTLHVGLDTFAPVTEEDPRDHKIHTEWCELTAEAAELVNRTKEAGRRVIAVGTTSARTLESAASVSRIRGRVAPFCGSTGLFILPGYSFKVVDAMLTNFHLPKSTLLMMVSAFAGRERILTAYQVATQNDYRFYSFGDAMLIL